jgi:hypothetical protein
VKEAAERRYTQINGKKAVSSWQSTLESCTGSSISIIMLTEIAAEALHFLSRRDLDETSAVSKWLDATIAQFF